MKLNVQPQLQDLLDSLKQEFSVYELEVAESPIFIAVAMPHEPGVTGLRPRLPAGRGLSAAQSMLTASAESIELLASLAQNCGPTHGKFIAKENHAYVLTNNLGGGSDQLFSAQKIYLDWAAVFNEPLLFDADSNGCASGHSLEEAVDRAVLECIERDAVAIWWYARQSRPHIPLTCLDRISPRLSWWLSTRDRHVKLIDVTSDIGVPVVAAISHDVIGGQIAIGSAAAKQLDVAAIAAVTELIQMEVSMTIGSANPELDNWHAKASIKDMQQFHPNATVAEIANSIHSPLAQLIAADFQAFSIDLTRELDLLKTVRVITPALSSLRHTPNMERILTCSIKQPQFGGVTTVAELETLELY